MPVLPANPNDERPPKPREIDLSLDDIERAVNITRPKTDAEKRAEAGFEANLEQAAEEVNPGNSTLNAMEGK